MKIKRIFITLTASLFICSNVFSAIIEPSVKSTQTDFSNEIDGLITGVENLSPSLNNVISAYNSANIITAKDQINKILKKNPADPQALHVAGIIFLQEKRYKNAQVAFEAALKSEMRNPAILSKLGVTRLLKGDYSKGKKILNLTLNLDPNNKLALFYLAWLADKDGLQVVRVDYLSKLINIVKPEALSGLHIAKADALIKTKQYEKTIDLLAPLLKKESDNTDNKYKAATIFLVESYINTKHFVKASKLLDQATKNKLMGSVQAAVFKVELPIKQKNNKQALQIIDTAIGENPESEHIIRFSASKAFAELKEDALAIEQMKGAVQFLEGTENKDTLFSALNDLSALYITANRKIDALRLMHKYVDKYPDSPRLNYQLAELQISMNQLADAYDTLDKILQKHPDFNTAYYLKGIVARREKRYAKAEGWFAKVNQKQPTYERAWVQRAATFMDNGKPDKALEVLATAVEKNKVSTSLWFEYGALLTNLQKHEDAIKAYKTVLGYFPTHLPSIDNLAGELLILETEPQEALYFALKAVEMDPTDKVLQLNYLEALFQNENYEQVLSNVKLLESGLSFIGRFQYLIGASHLKLGNKEEGIKYLKLANKDSDMESRYRQKISKLLNN